MNKKNLNILIVSGGSFQGLTLIKGLRYSNLVRIIMCDSSIENVNKYFVDGFYVVPEASKKEKFIDSLLNICIKESIRIIFPSTDIELFPLAENLKLFKKKNIHVAVSDPDILELTRNKLLLYKFLIKEGFPSLPVLDATDISLKFPILGKPLYSWGSKGIVVLNSRSEMNKYNLIELKTNYAWQPYLKDFEEYSIDCAINFDGKRSIYIIRRRLKTIGGFSVINEYVYDKEVEETTDKFVKLISSKGARGIFNIQILKKGSNYFFSDVNPRIGTSSVFSYKLGINFPLFLCSHINPEAYPQPQIISKSKKIKMIRYLEELWIEKEDSDKIKGIVFDLDDTLINQKQWIMDKLEILWPQFRRVFPRKKEFLLEAIQIIEEGNRSKLFDALSIKYKLSNSLKEELINNYREIEPKKCPLFPDVLPTLKGLKKMDFKLALLTDNPSESQKQKIRICNLEEFFGVIVYSRELKQEKPSKTAFKEITKVLKMPEQSLIMVGDNLYKDIFGSLESNYKSAYWIVREGTFFNFEQRFFDKLVKKKYNFKKINDLRHILWSLQ